MKIGLLSRIKGKSLMLLCTVFLMIYQIPIGQANIATQNDEVLLEEAFLQIGRQYGVFFSYDRTIVSTIKVKYESDKYENVEDALSYVLEQTDLKFQIFDKRYVAVYRDTEEGVKSLEKMIAHFQGIVDQKKLESSRMKKRVRPLKTYSINEVFNKRLVINVSGTIKDRSGEPLIGVNVIVKGSDKGTATDINGSFTLEDVDENAVLVISYIGYQTQELVLNGRSSLDIILTEDSQTLEEVVVVGYGTQKKINMTGSVESINERDIVSRPIGQASMALQGVAPGVTVTQNSGKPGSDGGVIRIRGIGTLSDSNPLVLIDGVPASINDIDVNEIENISILKDAASASIYGSRAANGVILITSKRAKTNDFSLTYRTNMGWQEPTALMQKVSGYDHMVMINEAARNVGQNVAFSEDYIEAYKQNAPSDEYPETNWHEVMLKNRAFQQSHYLGINSGGEKFRLLGSLSYMDQDGIMDSNFKRLNARLNTDVNLKDNLSFRINMAVRNSYRLDPPQSWGWMARYPHNLSGKNEDGTWGVGWDGQNGWASLKDGGLTRNNETDLITNFNMDWQPIPDLNIGFQVAPRLVFEDINNFRKQVDLYFPDGVIVNPSEFKANLTENYNKTITNNYKATIEYTKSISSHGFKVLGGWEAIDFRNQWIRGFRDQYPLENYNVLNSGSTANQTATGSAYEWALNSYFGRVNYNFEEKYLLEANLRMDGSSRFGEGYKYGLFPSLSFGWRTSEESFFSRIKWIDELKIRGSWGRLGNQNIGSYPFASTVSLGQNYVFGNDNPAIGAALLNAANSVITWETTEMVNFGIDAAFWKIFLTADYYIRNTSDILLDLPIPQIAGLNAPFQNAGKVRNKGWDIRLQYNDHIGDFYYRIGAVLSDVKNEVVDLVGSGPYIESRTIIQEGHPINSLFGLQSLGYFQSISEVENHASQFGNVQPGDIKYKDQNGDGVINAQDRVIMGNSIPRYTFGLNLSFDYKGFDFGAFLQGVAKVDGYLDNFATMAFYLGGTAQEWHKDYWREDNPDASYPRLTFNFPNNEQVSSEWVRSAAYLRLKNVQLGYTLPRSFVDRIGLSKCRFFMSGQNMFTIHNFYDSFDPEAPTGEGTFYPMVKVMVFGAEINF